MQPLQTIRKKRFGRLTWLLPGLLALVVPVAHLSATEPASQCLTDDKALKGRNHGSHWQSHWGTMTNSPSSKPSAITILALTQSLAQADHLQQQLNQHGLRLQSRRWLEHLQWVISEFQLPAGANAQQLLQQLRQQCADVILDLNHPYELSQNQTQQADGRKPKKTDLTGPAAMPRQLIGWPRQCHATPRIGIVDVQADTSHPSLQGKRIINHPLRLWGQAASRSSHGTAVASVLVGSGKTPGLLPAAELHIADPFSHRPPSRHETTSEQANEQANEQATAVGLVRAINTLLGQQVNVINMSLAGPHNQVLAKVMQLAQNRGVLLVAAVGNDGWQDQKRYPAAYAEVIAVTAVDIRQRLYPMANQGMWVDIAAPGVDIYAAHNNGKSRYFSGTSFAAPYVTALLAAQTNHTASKQTNKSPIMPLDALSKDLGVTGHDRLFGHGLLRFPHGQTDWCQ